MTMQLRLWMGMFAIVVLAACTGVMPDSPQTTSTPASGPEETSAQAASSAEEAPAASLAPAQRLIDQFDGESETNGDVLFLFGQVVDANGDAIPNAVVEIWQTDASGYYDHPRDPGTDDRDPSYQFFGSTPVDASGWYAFRTIVPGRYEPRPRHIHYKVKQDGNTLLTSQFYFSDDIAVVEGEAMVQAIGESGDLLLIQLVQGEDGLLANGRIVVDTGIGDGALPLTPSQAEGPYYPVVSLDDYDNDLVRLP